MLNVENWKMKSILKEVLVGAVLLFILSNILSYFMKPTLDSNHLPKLEVTLLDGSTFYYEEGKPLVLHFWANWCKVCKLEAQNIERLSKEYRVLTIAVNSGSDEEVRSYLRDRRLTFSVVNDTDGHLVKQFKVEAFPTTFFYDGKGELKFTEVGYITTAGLMARAKLAE